MMQKILAVALLGSLLAGSIGPAIADHPCKQGEVRDEKTKECKAKK
ncbi:MAG: hypothetical protein K2X43_09055 [Hyphomonadaceae bacterium]|nr:hypothetical protein [Hyphomonadaceae bacterium]